MCVYQLSAYQTKAMDWTITLLNYKDQDTIGPVINRLDRSNYSVTKKACTMHVGIAPSMLLFSCKALIVVVHLTNYPIMRGGGVTVH